MSIAEDVEAIIAGYTDIEVDPGGANAAIVRYLGTDERLARERLVECVALSRLLGLPWDRSASVTLQIIRISA